MRERIFRSVGGFRVPGGADTSGPVVKFFEFLNRCKTKWDATSLNDKKTSILFVSAGDCRGEALIMQALVETKTPQHILMFDPVIPAGALEHMKTSVPAVPSQHYFSTMNALTAFCEDNETTPALVVSLNHSLGMLSPHPMHLNSLRETLAGFQRLTNSNPYLHIVLCYENHTEGYQIIETELRTWTTRYDDMIGPMEQLVASMQQRRRQEASDREVALQLERLQMQEFSDFQLARALQDMPDT